MLYKRIEWRKKQITQYIYLHTHKCSIHYKENLSFLPISTHAQAFFFFTETKQKKKWRQKAQQNVTKDYLVI